MAGPADWARGPGGNSVGVVRVLAAAPPAEVGGVRQKWKDPQSGCAAAIHPPRVVLKRGGCAAPLMDCGAKEKWQRQENARARVAPSQIGWMTAKPEAAGMRGAGNYGWTFQVGREERITVYV